MAIPAREVASASPMHSRRDCAPRWRTADCGSSVFGEHVARDVPGAPAHACKRQHGAGRGQRRNSIAVHQPSQPESAHWRELLDDSRRRRADGQHGERRSGALGFHELVLSMYKPKRSGGAHLRCGSGLQCTASGDHVACTVLGRLPLTLVLRRGRAPAGGPEGIRGSRALPPARVPARRARRPAPLLR